MKSAYYGIKLVAVSSRNDEELHMTVRTLESMTYEGYGKDALEELEKIMESVRNDTSLLVKYGVKRKDKELILTQEDEERLKIGDYVTLNNKMGKILNKIYDPVEKVMNYYTDIIISEEEDKDSLKGAKAFSLYKLGQAKKHLEEINSKAVAYSKQQEVVSKKGFWSRIFGR